MKRLLLISDIDSVLCQTVPRALDWIYREFGVLVPDWIIETYELEGNVLPFLHDAGIEIDLAELQMRVTHACWKNASFYLSLLPRYTIWQSLHYWQQRGYALQFMTRRTQPIQIATANWLKKHGFEVETEGALRGWPKVIHEAEKAELSRQACEHYQKVIFLEDALHHAIDINEQSNAEVWVVPQPWNRQASAHGIERLDDEKIARRLANCENFFAANQKSA